MWTTIALVSTFSITAVLLVIARYSESGLGRACGDIRPGHCGHCGPPQANWGTLSCGWTLAPLTSPCTNQQPTQPCSGRYYGGREGE